MSSIAAVDPTQTTPLPTPTQADASKLGKDDFLKLLMAQLGQQDPTAPADSSQFVAQLAQFAGLEQMQNTNDALQSLLVGQAASQQTAVINMVGKNVTYRTDQLNLADASGATAGANLSGAAAKVTATITNASGQTVRTLDLGAQSAGAVTISWDGRDQSGTTQPPGQYTVQVTAVDAAGQAVTVDGTATGEASGVSFAQGAPTLVVGTNNVKLSDVVQINERTTP
jgi:flagellar basal-body rod modification protein FlgD